MKDIEHHTEDTIRESWKLDGLENWGVRSLWQYCEIKPDGR